MSNFRHGVIAVLHKEFLTEIREFHSIATILLLIAILVVLTAFCFGEKIADTEALSAVFWLNIYFVSSLSQLRTFTKEFDGGTLFFLRSIVRADSIYIGKFLFNSLLACLSNILLAVLFLAVLYSGTITSFAPLLAGIVAASIAISSVMTTISVMLSSASGRGSLMPVLAFPLLLPVLYIGISFTKECLGGNDAFSEIMFLLAYSGVIISASAVLIDYVWDD